MNIDRLPLNDAGQLSAAVSHPLPQLQALIADKGSHYGSFQKKKKDGTSREINPPKADLADIQHALKAFLHKYLVWTKAVHGGVTGRSIITNAEPHVGKAMVANLDISKFFPSTKTSQVEAALKRAGCSAQVAQMAAELTTFNNGLPQGSPTSTIIGNLVLEPMDSEMMRLCRRHNLTYTRYVDDITVSGDADLNPLRGAFIQVIQSVGFEAHPNKIHIVPRSKPQVVTGLIVNNRLRPTPDFVRELKATIRRCWEGPQVVASEAAEEGLRPAEFLRSVWGRVNHVKSVDKKLGQEIRALCVRLPRATA